MLRICPLESYIIRLDFSAAFDRVSQSGFLLFFIIIINNVSNNVFNLSLRHRSSVMVEHRYCNAANLVR